MCLVWMKLGNEGFIWEGIRKGGLRGEGVMKGRDQDGKLFRWEVRKG